MQNTENAQNPEQPIVPPLPEQVAEDTASGAFAHVETIVLPNGSSFNFAHQLTLGDILVSSALFLLLAFQVLKWLLNTVWERRG